MNKLVVILISILTLEGYANAQSVTPSVVASAGDFFSNTSGSVSWTLGEPMGETYSSSSNWLTQGYQQTWDIGTSVTSPSPVNADLYPNPTNDIVNIQFGADASGEYVIEVYNTLGQMLNSSQFAATPSARAEVSLSDYSDGIFFITVRKNDGSTNSTFKINKNS